MWKLITSGRKWSSLLLTFICVLLIAFVLSSCITINKPPAQNPPPSVTVTTSAPPTIVIPTPTSNQGLSLPSIESFVADPNYNPGGSKLAGLSDITVAIDGLWQQRYGQTYYQTTSALSDQYKPWGISQLQEVLNEFKNTPWVSLYDINNFCCRHMSALLQRELTIRGFKSWIVIGKDPHVNLAHAWVVVFLQSPTVQLVPVEATQLEIPQPGSQYTFPEGVTQTYQEYTTNGWVLEDIYDACAYGTHMWGDYEFDWWNAGSRTLQEIGVPTIVGATTPTPPPPPLPNYNLNVSVSPPGSGSVSPSSGQYVAGSQVTLNATPASGYTFRYWGGDESLLQRTFSSSSLLFQSNVTITMNSDVIIVANFAPITTATPVPTTTRFFGPATITFRFHGSSYPIPSVNVGDAVNFNLTASGFPFTYSVTDPNGNTILKGNGGADVNNSFIAATSGTYQLNFKQSGVNPLFESSHVTINGSIFGP